MYVLILLSFVVAVLGCLFGFERSTKTIQKHIPRSQLKHTTTTSKTHKQPPKRNPKPGPKAVKRQTSKITHYTFSHRTARRVTRTRRARAATMVTPLTRARTGTVAKTAHRGICWGTPEASVGSLTCKPPANPGLTTEIMEPGLCGFWPVRDLRLHLPKVQPGLAK